MHQQWSYVFLALTYRYSYTSTSAWVLLTHWGWVTHICIRWMGHPRAVDIACLVPSHYLNQCWQIINQTLSSMLQWNFPWNSKVYVQEDAFKNICKIVSILSWTQCVKTVLTFLQPSGIQNTVSNCLLVCCQFWNSVFFLARLPKFCIFPIKLYRIHTETSSKSSDWTGYFIFHELSIS